MNTPLPLLGNLSVAEFLRDYWQKKPLLIRQAVPGFAGLLDPQALIELACDPDVQARIVTQSRGQFTLQHSPFEKRDFAHFGKKLWSVLVQGVNHSLPEGTDLLRQFNFIPHARLDDLMVSFAPKGGGVGPHFDAYDVFLLQGYGHRRWQISTQSDHTLIEGAPLRILKNFQVEQEWILEPGDMLYLPPHCAHNGIAEDDCMTYSIGFRTPTHQELAEQFLVYLQDRISVDGVYTDPDLCAQTHPAEISDAMLEKVGNAIARVQWDKEDIANFLGCYLSEPKPHIYFDPPEPALSDKKFTTALKKHGVVLNLKTQMLARDDTLFVNGEAYPLTPADYACLLSLADQRHLSAGQYPATVTAALYEWYLDGYLLLEA